MIAQQVVILRWLLEDDWAAVMPTDDDARYDYLALLKEALETSFVAGALKQYQSTLNPDDRFSSLERLEAFVEQTRAERRQWITTTAHGYGYAI